MDFDLSEDQLAIRDAIQKICAQFPAEYWLDRDNDGRFPEEFVTAITAGGWLGIAMPEEHGGAGLGISEAAILTHTIARSGAGFSGASSVHLNLFGPHPIVVFGTEAQKSRFLPRLIKGKDRACFGVTEPDAGLNTTRLKTMAMRRGDHYVVNGRKLWTTTAQTANKILLIARTSPLDSDVPPAKGLSLFYTDLNPERIEVREIPRWAARRWTATHCSSTT